MEQIIIVVLLLLAVLAGVFFVARRSALDRASTAKAGLPSAWEARQAGDCHYQLRFQPPRRGKHAHPSLLSVRVPTASKIDLQVTRETWFDRLCKSLGIAQEFQTGDRGFDADWYLRGEIDSRLGMQLRHGDMRGPMRALLEQGFTSLRVQQGWLQADWTGFDPGHHPEPGATAAPALAAIAAALPPGSSAQAPRQYAAMVALWSVVVGSGCCLLLGIEYPPVRAWDLWRLVLPTAALGWVLLAWIAAFVLRGHSRSHDRWLLLILAGLLTCTIGARGVLGWWNGARDTSEIVVHEAAVATLWTKRHKKRTAYMLSVSDWKDAADALDYEISATEYARLRENQSRIEVHTRAGRLGVEWQLAFRLIP